MKQLVYAISVILQEGVYRLYHPVSRKTSGGKYMLRRLCRTLLFAFIVLVPAIGHAVTRADLEVYHFHDLWNDGGNVYALVSQKVSEANYTDPDGTISYQSDLYLLKILAGTGAVSRVKLDTLYMATNSTATGAISIQNAQIIAFMNHKTSATYAMDGNKYLLNKDNLSLSSQTQLFTYANWGWYPVINSSQQISHFSFAGYYRMLDTTDLGYVAPATMQQEYDSERMQHSSFILPDTDPNVVTALLDQFGTGTGAATAVPTAGLVAYYPFDVDALDASGNNNNGLINGGVSFVTGAVGKGAKFNGINSAGGGQNPDYIRVPNSSSLQFTNAMTVSYWARIDGNRIQTGADCSGAAESGISGTVLGKSGDRNGFLFNEYDKDSGFSINPWSGGLGVSSPAGSLTSAYGAFRHVTYTVNGSTASLYVNGALLKSATGTVDFSPSNARDMYIGASYNRGGACLDFWGQFDGVIDELRIYNRVLSNSEIQQLYSATNSESPVLFPPTLSDQTIDTFSLSSAILVVGDAATVSATATSGLAVSFTSATPGICTVSGSTVTGVNAGICTLAADQAGDGSYNAAAQVTQTFTVTQAGASCSTSVAPASSYVSSSSGTGDITVTASSTCAWTATSNADWITVTSGGSGSGNGSVAYSVAAHTGTDAHTGTIAVGGQSFSVVQSPSAAATYYDQVQRVFIAY